jgi:hypothetical protein
MRGTIARKGERPDFSCAGSPILRHRSSSNSNSSSSSIRLLSFFSNLHAFTPCCAPESWLLGYLAPSREHASTAARARARNSFLDSAGRRRIGAPKVTEQSRGMGRNSPLGRTRLALPM